MLAHPQLPPSLIERCIDVLKEIMPSERELIRVVVEVIMELREYGDPDMNEAQVHSLGVIFGPFTDSSFRMM
jgi:condensin complex subunit 3